MIETSIFNKRLLTDLRSTQYLGYYYRKNLEELVASLQNKAGINVIQGLISRKHLDGYNEIYKLWKDCNFNESSMAWYNYYPNADFDAEIVDDIAFYLRLEGVHRAWISRIDPGYYAPLHWDVDDNELKYLTKGPIKRYTITLNQPTLGHIFIVGKDHLYEVPIGSIFKWNDHREWHIGINGGIKSKFTLHVLGY